jgi:hypothetical protein
MRKQINPMVAVIVVIASILVLGLVGMKVMDSMHHEAKVIVQPADPNDPRFKTADPNLKVDNSGT